MQETGRINQDDPCWEAREAWDTGRTGRWAETGDGGARAPGGKGTENVQSGQVPPGTGRGHRLRPCLSYNNYRLFYVPSQESIGESTSEHLVHLPRHGTDPAARSYRQVSALCRMQLACTRAGTLRTTVRPCRVTLTLWGCPLAMFLLSASMLKGSLVPPRL